MTLASERLLWCIAMLKSRRHHIFKRSINRHQPALGLRHQAVPSMWPDTCHNWCWCPNWGDHTAKWPHVASIPNKRDYDRLTEYLKSCLDDHALSWGACSRHVLHSGLTWLDIVVWLDIAANHHTMLQCVPLIFSRQPAIGHRQALSASSHTL